MNKLLHTKKTFIFTLAFFIFSFQLTFGQDDICNLSTAPILPINATCTNTAYNVQSSFTDSGPAPCTGTSYRDGWYRIVTGPSDTSITITISGGNRQAGLALYTSCSSASVACSVPGNANANLTATVTPNTTYLLRIMRTNNANNNDMFGNICVTSNPTTVGDECSSAVTLTPSSICNYSSYNLSGMTRSTTTPLPGCASYSGVDMWFKFVVPSTGNVTVTTSAGTTSDAGMALYTGTCSGLTLLECDDDDGPDLMPEITRTGLTPGSTVFVRVWPYGTKTAGTFGICVKEDSKYCNSTSTSSSYYIESFSTSGAPINITNNNSGYSNTGFGDFTHMMISAPPGSTVNFSTDFNGTTYSFGFRIWVDWNDDGQFNNTNELLYSSGAYVTGATSSFTIPTATALGNYRLRIRANYYNSTPDACGQITSGETEDYILNVGSMPPCNTILTGLNSSILTANSASITWNAPATIPANGYHYYISNSSSPSPTTSTTPTETAPSSATSVTLNGLTLGLTYYVWVRPSCGGATGNGIWFGPIVIHMPNCVVGNSVGTTTMACPAVVSGGLGLNGSAPAPIACGGTGCTTLEATYLKLGQTTNYTVEPIGFTPPYQFNCLKNPISVNIDDVWSPLINLPFNFCFYGQNYNSCLVSSNGVVTFDTSKYTPTGGSTWEIENNLPNVDMFTNAIFGVFHDIDPSLGGEVGWELITLNTGCRALVAAWDKIPYYSTACHSLLYSGMIVFYENTNIIEVYIKDKPVCSTWNDGNAIVGIQNGDGTVAVVPANRNGLSPDWATTNEAWRFVPSGPSITSIKWFEGTDTTGIPIGTSDEITVCPTDTQTYTAQVTYQLCNTSNLVEIDTTEVTVARNKTWTGSVDSNWHNANNWNPVGIPSTAQCITIPTTGNPCVISQNSPLAQAYNIHVQSGGRLQVTSNNTLNTTSYVDVDAGGTFEILNSGNLLQTNDVNNSGSARIQRITNPMYRYDYTYWNSPVTEASNFTLLNLSPTTQPDKYYSWRPFVGTGTGNWIFENPSNAMIPTKGYIVRAPQTYSMDPSIRTAYTATFIGTPNNGTILAPVAHGTMGTSITDDNWNLIGNPYPSSLSASAFLMHAHNQNSIDGTLYFWTHNSPPSAAYPDPFYGDFAINYTDTDYASWNLMGGVGTIASTGGPQPTGNIGTGQSFFVLSKVASGTARFENAMRGSSNNQFFRMSNTSDFSDLPATEIHTNFTKYRVWLNLTGPQNSFNQIMVGYAEGASLSYDRALDGRKNEGNSYSFYSLITDEHLVIQARPLPFENTDIVPLGFNSPVVGNYRIGIDTFDDYFNSKELYLEDLLLNVIHDLKTAPYIFTSEIGRFDGRFQLRYQMPNLSVTAENQVKEMAFLSNNHLYYQGSDDLKRISIFDITGKKISEFKPANKANQHQWQFQAAQATYVARMEYESGKLISVKLLKQ